MDVMVVLLLFYSLGIYAGIRFVQANLSKGFQKPALLWEDSHSGLDRRIFRMMHFFEDMSASGETFCLTRMLSC